MGAELHYPVCCFLSWSVGIYYTEKKYLDELY